MYFLMFFKFEKYRWGLLTVIQQNENCTNYKSPLWKKHSFDLNCKCKTKAHNINLETCGIDIYKKKKICCPCIRRKLENHG